MSDQPDAPVAGSIQSPPPAPMPAHDVIADDPRTHLHRLAAELIRSHNRRLVVEYLRLRRSLR